VSETIEISQEEMQFIKKVAKSVFAGLSTKRIELQDLEGYGSRGFLEAKRKFDPTHGATFNTFAWYRIKGAMFDGLRQMGWLSRSEYSSYKKFKYEEAANEFMQEQSVSTSNVQAPNQKEAQHKIANTIQNLAAVFVMTTETIDETASSQDETPEEQISRSQMAALLKSAVDKLDEREQKFVQSYYFEHLSLTAAGELLGISRSWASRLHNKIINKLKIELSSQQHDFELTSK
jgi:RNA polymerase sigma factor for flagellar operon FliA